MVGEVAKGKHCVDLVPQEVGPIIAQYKVITCLCRVICRQQISALSITEVGQRERPWKEITSGIDQRVPPPPASSHGQQREPPKLDVG